MSSPASIPLQIFLHKVDDRGESYDSFVSICSVEDLDRFPSSRAGVTKGSLYRRSSAKIQFTHQNAPRSTAFTYVFYIFAENFM